jgi:hypothetical protein
MKPPTMDEHIKENMYIREYIYYGNVLVSVPFSREGCVVGRVAKDTGSKRRLVPYNLAVR